MVTGVSLIIPKSWTSSSFEMAVTYGTLSVILMDFKMKESNEKGDPYEDHTENNWLIRFISFWKHFCLNLPSTWICGRLGHINAIDCDKYWNEIVWHMCPNACSCIECTFVDLVDTTWGGALIDHRIEWSPDHNFSEIS